MCIYCAFSYYLTDDNLSIKVITTIILLLVSSTDKFRKMTNFCLYLFWDISHLFRDMGYWGGGDCFVIFTNIIMGYWDIRAVFKGYGIFNTPPKQASPMGSWEQTAHERSKWLGLINKGAALYEKKENL